MNVIYVEGRTPIGKLPTRYSNSGFNAVQYWTEVEICLREPVRTAGARESMPDTR
jgi:hypothetical protein